jgi:1-acyl-sn-glycerol-3-phosphate acyltransferase
MRTADTTAGIHAGPVKVAHRLGVRLVRAYHRLEITTPALSITEPVLFVANHGFGGVFDLNVFATFASFEQLEIDRPVTALTHQLAWTLQVGRFIEALGARPAGRHEAEAAFARGHHVLVLPGGDVEAGKSFTNRNKIVLSGRRGFAQLAIDAGVPVVPIVTAGAGESVLVLSDGQRLAHALRVDGLLRMKALPVSVSVPWGLNVGVVGMVPYLPLPTKLRTAVLHPIAAQPAESASQFGDRVEAAMQSALDSLTADRRLILG